MSHGAPPPDPWPGAPRAGFDDPFAVLQACHERAERTLRLLQRLRAHLAAMGRDDQVRQAARDVMDYFDQIAPAHHEDEERHVFPPLLAAGLCVDTVCRLQRDHLEMATVWPQVRGVLERVEADRWRGFGPGDEQLLERFARMYDWHIAAENELVFPAAAQQLDAAAQRAMGLEMAQRRGGSA